MAMKQVHQGGRGTVVRLNKTLVIFLMALVPRLFAAVCLSHWQWDAQPMRQSKFYYCVVRRYTQGNSVLARCIVPLRVYVFLAYLA